MGYIMKGSPVKLGTIQGTSGHVSALKQKEEEKDYVKMLEQQTAKGKYEEAVKKQQEALEPKNIEGTPEYEAEVKKKEDIAATEAKEKEDIAATEKEAKMSEKSKRLKRETDVKDEDTDKKKVQAELAEKKEGKYGKGLFGGAIRRGRAKRKYKKAQKKEDVSRRELEKSERYDLMSPKKKQKFDDKRVEKVAKTDVSRKEAISKAGDLLAS